MFRCSQGSTPAEQNQTSPASCIPQRPCFRFPGPLIQFVNPLTIFLGVLTAFQILASETSRADDSGGVESEVQSQQLAIAAPKVEDWDAFMDDRGHCCLRTVARVMELGHTEFFDWIKGKGYVFSEDHALQPQSDLRDDYMRVIFHDKNGKKRPQTVVSRLGVAWLRQRWAADQLRLQREATRAITAARQPRLAGI